MDDIEGIINGQTTNEYLIDVNVATTVERCMCGIALSRTENNAISSSPTSDQSANVFVCCTEAVSTATSCSYKNSYGNGIGSSKSNGRWVAQLLREIMCLDKPSSFCS